MSDTIRPRDEHGRFIAASNGDISAELATIQPYAPPFWEERAWQLDGRTEDEQYTLISLRHGLELALTKQVESLEVDESWATIPNRRRATAAVFYFDADISNRAIDVINA